MNIIGIGKIFPQQFSSFEEIVQKGHFNNGYGDNLATDKECREAILATVTNTDGEELVIYWEGDNQIIPGGKNIYEYFKSKGFEVVEKAHPSLLINSMHQLTEDKLEEMGIPHFVKIILPTAEDLLFPYEKGERCFLAAARRNGLRWLSLATFDVLPWSFDYAFILRKIKK